MEWSAEFRILIEGQNALTPMSVLSASFTWQKAKTRMLLATYISSMCNSNLQGPVARKMDSAIHRINHYPLDSVIDFPNTYLLDNDLPGG